MKGNIKKKNWWGSKKIIISIVVALALVCSFFSMVMYSNQELNDGGQINIISANKENDNQANSNTESTSSSIGKSIEAEELEASKESNTNLTKESTITQSTNSVNNTTNENSVNETNQNNSVNNTVNTNSSVAETVSFLWPIEGELLKAFSSENLLYSSTLDEWITHNGIDIKAEKASIVRAAEDGTITSIKNDPRYGLTVIIDHNDNYRTIYSNLLTTEFVQEGESVLQGQTIGTVGNTATFEIADESHLHFELLQNFEYLDPIIYLEEQ